MTQLQERGSSAASFSERSDGESSQVNERPIGVIVNDLWEKAESLLRQEMRLGISEAEEKVNLLKKELGEQASELRTELMAKAVGGAVAFAGLLALVAGVTLLLAKVVAPWLAALITGAVLAAVGVALTKRKWKPPEPPNPEQLIPERTVHNVKEDIKAISGGVRDSAIQ